MTPKEEIDYWKRVAEVNARERDALAGEVSRVAPLAAAAETFGAINEAYTSGNPPPDGDRMAYWTDLDRRRRFAGVALQAVALKFAAALVVGRGEGK